MKFKKIPTDTKVIDDIVTRYSIIGEDKQVIVSLKEYIVDRINKKDSTLVEMDTECFKSFINNFTELNKLKKELKEIKSVPKPPQIKQFWIRRILTKLRQWKRNYL
jgi:hypothetical protein